nr:MAG TPA: hypothetical protein [Caudoviricetes sp.]
MEYIIPVHSDIWSSLHLRRDYESAPIALKWLFRHTIKLL